MTAAARARVDDLVRFLCSPVCAGRLPDSPEGIAARHRIVAEFRAAGLQPGGTDGYLQPVPRCGANVLGELPGRGPLADRTIIVAAHYDHLGKLPHGQAFWGADDNAAAVAILVEVARALAAGPADGRRVVFAAYDGEEPPHFLHSTMGSMYHAAHPTAPLAGVDMMICMDLCGHAIGPAGLPREVRDSLFVLGAELSPGTAAHVDAAASPGGVYPRRIDLDLLPPLSDYYAFRSAGVPVLFLTCGRWQHYHQPTDTPDRLDLIKVVATAEYLTRLTARLRTSDRAPIKLKNTRDDVSTIATLRSLAATLAPYSPHAAAALRQLDALAAQAAKKPLDEAARGQIAALVHALEHALA